MAYFLYRAANDTTNRKTIPNMLEYHGQHLSPEHKAAIESLDKDQVTHFLTNECQQYAAIDGQSNGLIFLAEQPDAPGSGPDESDVV